MDEYSHSIPGSPPGYRLHRLEVSNWGTFDSTDGTVHVVEPRGGTTLLVGRNGSGKSTLVDSLLTLLVPNQIRNYNVAAGAGKRERDERSYIKGACGKQSRESDDNGSRPSEVKYLRPQASHCSVLLAVFRNEVTGGVFSIAQVLHVNAEGSVSKVFCFRAGEASIAKDMSGIRNMERLREQMERRGFVATTKQVEFASRLQKALRFKSKAIDIFNQTVAVKDIESLNDFIRQHMLDQKPWREKIDAVLGHFDQLSQAHRELVKVRDQYRILGPVKEKGLAYQEMEGRHQAMRTRHGALEAFFRHHTIELFAPEIEKKQEEHSRAKSKHTTLSQSLQDIAESIRQLKNAIEQAGGDRLKQLPLLIRIETDAADAKRKRYEEHESAIRRAGIRKVAEDDKSFEEVRHLLESSKSEAQAIHANLDSEIQNLGIQQYQDKERSDADKKELESLSLRRTNLPESRIYLRQRMCEELRLSVTDLPFAAELMAVKQEDSAWEASLELVLRGLGLSLLVPARYYRQVSDYIDQTRLRDSDGKGQRLVYLHVREEVRSIQGTVAHQNSLLRKLQFREGHRLLPWLRAELAERFDYRCCRTMDEFRQSHGLALTQERHFRTGSVKHEKDDRPSATSRRDFILGWDNAEKKRSLREDIRKFDEAIEQRRKILLDKTRDRDAARDRMTAVDEARKFEAFSEIDFHRHTLAKAELEREKKQIEDDNDTIVSLRSQLAEKNAEHDATDRDRTEASTNASKLADQIAAAKTLVATAEKHLRSLETEGRLATVRLVFPDIEAELSGPLLAESLFGHEQALKERYAKAISAQKEEISPLQNALTSAMASFLGEFKDMRHELEATPDYLGSFLSLRESIEREGLPQQEQRFKERLNEKVTHEIGLLNGALESERGEIADKIDLLNDSLKQLEYRRGTFIKLEARLMRDQEIDYFKRTLYECLSGTFEGTLEADEARYLRIAKLVERMKEEPRWTEKVTDVRRWFDFVARELYAETGIERESYSDSEGKSGGEKAKLAFTILVAAIAYQYDIDPNDAASDRFHFVVVDEMFSKVDDQYSEYALELFKKFGLQLLIVAPLDAKARITEPYVGCYLHVLKDERSNHSEVFSMTAEEFCEMELLAPETSSS